MSLQFSGKVFPDDVAETILQSFQESRIPFWNEALLFDNSAQILLDLFSFSVYCLRCTSIEPKSIRE
jgi:hypothetical protein